MHLFPWAVSIAGSTLNLWAIFTVCSQGLKDRVAPFYANLLFADLIQLCCTILMVVLADWKISFIVSFIFDFAVAVRHCFMLLAALERYLIITCPRWRQSERNIKKTVAGCVLVWIFPAVSVLTFYFWVDLEVLFKVYSALIVLPLPLLMFFLHGIVEALAASSSVPSAEKRTIAGVLVPELLIYSLLFLPRAVWLVTHGDTYGDTFDTVSIILVELSPLADVALYVLMRKEATDEHSAAVSCSDSKNDCNIVTVSCREMERKQKEKCGQECFEQQGHCGLCNGVSPPSNGSSVVTYVLLDPLSIEKFTERHALLPMNTTPEERDSLHSLKK